MQLVRPLRHRWRRAPRQVVPGRGQVQPREASQSGPGLPQHGRPQRSELGEERG